MRGVEVVEMKACGVSCRVFVNNTNNNNSQPPPPPPLPRPKRVDGLKRLLRRNKVGDVKRAEKAAAETLPAVFELKANMHCDDCATKIRNMVREYPGVVEVKEEGGTEKLTVVGRADPELLREWVEQKAKRKVQLVLLPAAPPPNDAPAAAPAKADDKKMTKEVTVAFKLRLDCDACIQKCQRTVFSIKGVQEVSIQNLHDLTHVVKVRGTMDPNRIARRIRSKLNRHVEAVAPNSSPPLAPCQPQAEKDSQGQGGVGEGTERAKASSCGKEAKEKAGAAGQAENTQARKPVVAEPVTVEAGKQGDADKNKTNVGNMEEHPAQPYVLHVYPPQIFSEENPNACSIM